MPVTDSHEQRCCPLQGTLAPDSYRIGPFVPFSGTGLRKICINPGHHRLQRARNPYTATHYSRSPTYQPASRPRPRPNRRYVYLSSETTHRATDVRIDDCRVNSDDYGTYYSTLAPVVVAVSAAAKKGAGNGVSASWPGLTLIGWMPKHSSAFCLRTECGVWSVAGRIAVRTRSVSGSGGLDWVYGGRGPPPTGSSRVCTLGR